MILGRGAGHVLPVATTLHVRVIAPAEDRVAYFADWLRLPPGEAAAEVNLRDRRRERFLSALTDPSDPTAFDLIVNSSRLGEAAAADLIVAGIDAKTPADSRPEIVV